MMRSYVRLRVVVAVECIYEPHVFSHSVTTSSADCNRCNPPSSLVCGQLLTICNIVWPLPQGHMRAVSTGCAEPTLRIPIERVQFLFLVVNRCRCVQHPIPSLTHQENRSVLRH